MKSVQCLSSCKSPDAADNAACTCLRKVHMAVPQAERSKMASMR